MVRTVLAPTKPDIRREMLDRRRGLPKSMRLQNSRFIAQRLKHLDSYVQAQDILFFLSLDEEVQTWEMMVQAFQQGKRVYLPLVDWTWKETRITRLPRLDVEFKKRGYGIKEPHKTHWNLVPPEQMGFVLVPGLAFDLSGGRVGFGAGFYDRLLQTLDKKTVKVGVAFDFQVIKSLPQTSDDQKVHMILTEKRAITFRQSRIEKG